MPFRASHNGRVYLLTDILNVLAALEIDPNRSGYAVGYLEALRRLATAFGIEYRPPIEAMQFGSAPDVVLIDAQQALQRRVP